ncbi:nuclease-related domain-containing protein [Pseudomonas congelans]|uniref:nuclease-related domain-containing protein n=1 Tax=Pseudomonas congelans TaxID=200452 RepID=UPI00117A9E1B|nr:nuclease-related domain-containing protein [Pseudomonas congelans]
MTSPQLKISCSEQEVFTKLQKLCSQTGYINALAFISLKDTTIIFNEKMKAEDMQHLFVRHRLIYNEIMVLLGLLTDTEITLEAPTTETIDKYISQTYSLMEELHASFFKNPTSDSLDDEPPFDSTEIIESSFPMREPIFYSGESAYAHQYRDFSIAKYSADDEWLCRNKGFDIRSATAVVHAVGILQNEALLSIMELQRDELIPSRWLDGYKLNPEAISASSGISLETTKSVIAAFTLQKKDSSFAGVNDFNAAKATPIIPLNDGSLVLIQYYALVESLYESPFYWMNQDDAYRAIASENRGSFTEDFAHDRLAKVFGQSRVFNNVDVWKGKRKDRLGEIDTLVVYGDRLIILQAKSKRLTMGARKGNDGLLRDDFKKAIQNSYDQAWLCAEAMKEPDLRLSLPDGTELKISENPKDILIINLISDHYPALSFQSSQFLKFHKDEHIRPPFVMDVFLLDALTEMLSTPLRLLGYIRVRVEHLSSFLMSHELTALAYHLKCNFSKESEVNFVMLEDDIAVDLEIAMSVRRDNTPGADTPDGILTRFSGTLFESVISQIEQAEDSKLIDLGFDLLAYDEDSCRAIDSGLKLITNKTSVDGQCHDFTLGSIQQNSGVTFHCNAITDSSSLHRLQAHCEKRKYRTKVNKWYGICVDPAGNFQCGTILDFTWKRSIDMDNKTAGMRSSTDPKLTGPKGFLPKSKKTGRNEKCPCGSGKKFKNCHL